MNFPFKTLRATETVNFVDLTLSVGGVLEIDFYQIMYEHDLRVIKCSWVGSGDLRALCEKLPTFKVLP